MSTFRVIQISDTHLSRDKDYFVANFDAVVDHVAHHKPDLVVNTGDIALNGPDVEDDLDFAAEQHRRLDALTRVIPGNHDLGDNPADPSHPPSQPVTPERLGAYERRFGAAHWAMPAGEWLLVGFNAQLFGTGLPDEAVQWSFLEKTFADAGERPVAVFLHKPLFLDEPGETDTAAHRYVPPKPRRHLMALMKLADVRLVTCGHVHQYRSHRHDGIDHVWCPSTAFVLPDELQPAIGQKTCGLVSYHFDGADVSFELVRARGMADTLITDVPAYGNLKEKMKQAGIRPAAA